jgi:chromosome segregation protein
VDHAKHDLRQHAARNEREHLEKLQQQLRTAIYEANTERVECDSKLGQVGQEIETLQREGPLIAEDLKHLSGEIEAAVHAQHQAKEKAAELEQLNAERQQQIERLDGLIAAARQKQSELAGQVTELKVAQAAAEQKKLALKEALAAMARQREQMQQDLSAGRSQIELDRQRRADCVAGVEKAKEEAARLAAEGAKLEAEARDLEQSRRGLQEKLQEVRRQLAEQRKSQEQATAEASARRVELGEADVRIENLIARASEEMHMNLIEQMPGYRHDEQRDWNAVNSEIADLRGKIERLGNVNLDAIPEQDELEKQRQFMDEQMADIRKSQDQLAELIRRINKERRELFVRTFEVVRNNFHELFRKLFGGGKADIILTNPEDVLDSGSEIIARPPGKETRSLSLLSGGEKTMTALALLFSIFKSRPSPFCLLDEVDAALDEANNQRFNRLVGEFVSASQFIVITHSKRTMSMSNVLYGLTMQEPGVSKRIAVRFDGAGKKSGEPLQAASA